MNQSLHITWEVDLSLVKLLRTETEKIIFERQISIEAFVHSAGIMKVMRMKDVDYDNALHIFNVNYFSAVELSQPFLKRILIKVT